MKKIIAIFLILLLLAAVSVWVYVDLMLNEKGVVNDFKACGVLSGSNTLNSDRFLMLLEEIEGAIKQQQLKPSGSDQGIYDLEKILPYVTDPLLEPVRVSGGQGEDQDGRIQTRLKVDLKLDGKRAGLDSSADAVMYRYLETGSVEITVNGHSMLLDDGYKAILRWSSDSRMTELSHQYGKGIIRPNVIKRIAAGLGILVLFFFILITKKRDPQPRWAQTGDGNSHHGGVSNVK